MKQILDNCQNVPAKWNRALKLSPLIISEAHQARFTPSSQIDLEESEVSDEGTEAADSDDEGQEENEVEPYSTEDQDSITSLPERHDNDMGESNLVDGNASTVDSDTTNDLDTEVRKEGRGDGTKLEARNRAIFL
ncbi:hypothetical protein CVT26_000692 [Gymnopilus dilepis]|uniref:Uncharacterized protein n=1 Tax=Gymnopilus dilepis TaxID=231916 RepID=A0A409X7V0_9AGAR|nr:hypothetical protein CVT26_000692 [Gymnopilus dilepis]